MKATRCPHCGAVLLFAELLIVRPDEEWMFTLQDDEPPEWICPNCHAGAVPSVWDVFYLPGSEGIEEVVADRPTQRELF